MSVYNQPRKRVIQFIILGMVILIITRLFFLQIVEKKYSKLADANAVLRKVVYPSRGIIYDRKGRSILSNDAMYDLVVTPISVKNIDTAYMCEILRIDKEEFRKRITTAIIKNGSRRVSIFYPLLPPEMFGRLQESMYMFQPGFELVQRQIRSYPFNAAANILGYIGEVSPQMLQKPAYSAYNQGDYLGMTGLERTYESVLMGQRGIQYLVKDNLNRPQGPYEKGEFDTAAIAGKNLRLALDVDLQVLGEHLMRNKIGSVVAIDPRTGGILTMVSAPTFDPNLLTGSYRARNFSRLFSDTTKPLFNRAIQAGYPPGSSMKPLTALIALDEGVITPSFGFPCGGAYTYCGRPIACTHHNAGHAANLRLAIANSCNAYFVHLYRMEVDAAKWGGVKKGHQHWHDYISSFGLGHKLGIDIPGESGGKAIDTAGMNRLYHNQWNSCSELYVGMGQGQVVATPLQMANAMCIIANKGFYYLPHFVDKIDNDDTELLTKFREKHVVAKISDSSYMPVIYGMQDVVERGTGMIAKIEGEIVCGKTGTAENNAIVNGKLTKLKNHSVFVAFAPRDNPKIAVAVIVENAGFGSTYAAPIASLIMEKYLHDTISVKRKPQMKTLLEYNTLDPVVREKSKLDSLNGASAKMTPDQILKLYFRD
ncbi:penicillin-binding protein 2 [Chitinophaga pinensis]|uniref:Peptidoglycan glycosyltransferase n=1 Tax=Chitinophaga pinensis (strain ATCC 43595 / DSM 2588 / LMG 13176 / NBRC 15968 / NCIMB 11800 / UQM 2034) TaxID=485918 RepID=A0A979FZ13_CHIPD|nr:penicillin-binding protein 2 [Chitinophaga pinensis]ACU57692.1 Peptidoglycan glycosyltransferase [Chitinophaga pinensis DSM 2588]